MTTPIYHTNPPGPLMARLCYTFPLGTRFVSYPRQEAAMPDCPPTLAAQRRALSTEFLEHARALRELLRLAADREQCIRDVWAQMMALEAAQRAPVTPRREGAQ